MREGMRDKGGEYISHSNDEQLFILSSASAHLPGATMPVLQQPEHIMLKKQWLLAALATMIKIKNPKKIKMIMK